MTKLTDKTMFTRHPAAILPHPDWTDAMYEVAARAAYEFRMQAITAPRGAWLDWGSLPDDLHDREISAMRDGIRAAIQAVKGGV